MKRVLTIIIHFVLVSLLSLLSFAGVVMYKTSSEYRKLIEKVASNINYETLLRSSITSFIALLLIVYGFYFGVFRFLLKEKNTKKSVRYGIGIIVIILVLEYVLKYIETCKPVNFSGLPATIIFTAFAGGIGLGARAIVEYFKDKEMRKELERKNLQSELTLLRSQINPHFLFNTLNNIDALIRKDPERASDLLIKLSVQMRYMLYDSNTDKIEFASEVEFIKDYIALQKMRMKNQQAVEFLVNGDYKGVLVPPMLFIPFIENDFKHCSKPDLDKAISISIFADKTNLRFHSKNIFDRDNIAKNDKIGGVGLELVKKRLELLYPGKHSLEISDDNGFFEVSIIIQLNGN